MRHNILQTAQGIVINNKGVAIIHEKTDFRDDSQPVVIELLFIFVYFLCSIISYFDEIFVGWLYRLINK